MAITTDKRLLKKIAELQEDGFSIDTGASGGLVCPVCLEYVADGGGWSGGCDHLLAHDLDIGGTGWEGRSCWVLAEGDDGDERWTFEPAKAKAKKDRFLIQQEWAPVLTCQADAGSVWRAWFAIPVVALRGKRSTKAALERLISKAQEIVTADEGDEEDEEE